LRKSVQSISEYFADALRNANVQRRGSVREAESTVCNEQLEYFAQEKRIALGLLMNSGHQFIGRLGSGCQLDEAAGIMLRKSREHDAVDDALSRKLRQTRRQRMIVL